MANNGLYFYKLISPYPEDITKECKLTVTEIDHNFLTLKDFDIKSADYDDSIKSIVLTRNNGEQLVVDLKPLLNGEVFDLNFEFEDDPSCSGATLRITYSTMLEDGTKSTITVPVEGLVTVDNINEVIGGEILQKVITDGTLKGDGTVNSPLGLSDTEKNRPAIAIIDKTEGEVLPEHSTIGDRYVTKEYLSEFGFLYDYYAVEKINEALALEGKGWRVPEKKDWDCLLNSIEPCEYRNHDSAMCHQILGKYAGTKLKSRCGWLEEPDCECKSTVPSGGDACSGDTTTEPIDNDEFDTDDEPDPIIPPYWGTDEYGMKILPTGYGDGDEIEHYFKKKTVFWTTTHVYNDLSQDLYVKEFDWNVSGVIQEAQCPSALFSIRLVKDFNGSNHFDSETIDGDTYQTKLFADCGTIWTMSNFASTKEEYNPVASNMGMDPYKRVVYFINVWNGNGWDKRLLEEGESIVIQDEDERCQHNIEYRVFTEDGCNAILVNSDDIIVERVVERILPLIEDEKEEREAADAALEAEISGITADIQAEEDARVAADQMLQGLIENEAIRAQDVEQQLWDAINGEIESRENVDQQLWDALNNEVSARTSVDDNLWIALTNEGNDRISADTALWEAISAASSSRTEIWSALTEEIQAREEGDSLLGESIENEAELREQTDNELWDAINTEIEQRTDADAEIKGQIIDNPADPQNEETAALGENGYVFKASDSEKAITLFSKEGTNDISIKFDADFGTF